MDKVIATILLIIAAVVGVGLVVNISLPAISRSSSAILSGAGKIDERIQTQISIIHATGDAIDNTKAHIWVMNIGAARITALDNCAIHFGREGIVTDFVYDAEGDDPPCWSYEPSGDWELMDTVKFTINNDAALSGTYLFKIATPNGVPDEHYFSIS